MNTQKKRMVALAIGCLFMGITGSVIAAEGDWLLRFGWANVSPNDGSSGVVARDAIGVDSGDSLYFTGSYMVSDSVGIELLAALPFDHDVTLSGSGKIAEVSHLPPTLSMTYHFQTDSSTRPYIGAGINYTTFSDERATAVINSIELEDSWGFALQAGVDVDINDKWFFNASARYIDIETTAETNLGDIDVDIDPWVFSIGIGTRF